MFVEAVYKDLVVIGAAGGETAGAWSEALVDDRAVVGNGYDRAFRMTLASMAQGQASQAGAEARKTR